jgi:hypothetical protein
MKVELPFRDYSVTLLLAFAALTLVIIRGDALDTLRRPWFLGLLAVLAISIVADVWRKRRGDPNR